jgi:Sel1 repeat-containing protein
MRNQRKYPLDGSCATIATTKPSPSRRAGGRSFVYYVAKRFTVKQRFTLDRQSFEQFIAAVSLFQPLQQAASKTMREENGPLLVYLLETLRAIDGGSLALQAALERVAELALHIVGGDCAVLWLFTSENLMCRATAGMNFEDEPIRSSLRSKLESAGAFGEDPPATVDLTSTLGKYSGSLGSSLAIAILPGGKIAGALAVFSVQSRTFTQRNYVNLRLLAGLAQYILTKRVAGRERHDSLDVLPKEHPVTDISPEMPVPSSIARSARAPFISRELSREHVQHGQIEHRSLPGPDKPVAVGGVNERPQIETGLPALSASAAPGDRKHMQRLAATALNAAADSLRRVRKVRVNWRALKQATPAFVILAVMSFFVGLVTGGRKPLANSPPSTAAAAPVTPSFGSHLNQKAAAMFIPNKSPAIPIQTSHLQITDRETAATIAELSKYELRNLRRAADYGDDEAALQLGMLYELGHGFPQSCSKAAKWVTRAAANGNAAAEYNLGLRYRDGDGVDANLEQAENWLRKAAAHKNSNAGRVLAELLTSRPEASVGKIAKTSQPAVRTP